MGASHPQHSYGAPAGSHGPSYSQNSFDTTGQVAPPGVKPRVTATLWEDEGSLCFQVEAKGVCVARREGKQKDPFDSRALDGKLLCLSLQKVSRSLI